ncbi:MAG TPA: M56 family metallopeptidase [Pirellulales bacterium]|jgi:beta-lactamase regulating signal transducer with metallopeptidase domain/Leucine-rich repeat (LRR) protein
MIDAWLSFAEIWGPNLWRASWQGGVALAVAWAIARWCTFLSPRVVCWVWRLACLKLLVALVWVSPVELALLPPEAVAPSLPPPAPVAVSPVLPDFAPDLDSVYELREKEVPPQSPPANEAPLVASQASLALYDLLLAAWVVGLTFCVYRTVRQRQAARRMVRSADIAPTEYLAGIYQEEARRMGVRRSPRLQLSAKVEGPILVGIWRPTIVLPSGPQHSFDEAELRLMLAHELAHYKRRDLAWNWLPTAATWLFFFHPLVWLMVRRWSEAQEAACDEALLQRQVARPAEYGRLLLKLAALSPTNAHAGLAAAGVLGAYRNLERRILTMARIRPYSRRRMLFAASALLLMGIVSVVPWRLTAQEAVASQEAVAATEPKEAPQTVQPKNLQTVQPKEPPKRETATGPRYVYSALVDDETAEKARRAMGTHPITVTGRATDADGKPVVGAKVHLASLGSAGSKGLAMTTTDEQGRYEFRDAQLPLAGSELPQGVFQVYSADPKHGVAWQGERYFYSVNRPKGDDKEKAPHRSGAVYADDLLVADLKFGPVAPLGGRLLDEAGKPIVGAKCEVIQCYKLEPKPKTASEEDADKPLPSPPTDPDRHLVLLVDGPATTTGADGKFEIAGLTKETTSLLRITHPDFAIQIAKADITDDPNAPKQKRGPMDFLGAVNLQLAHTRQAQLRLVYGDTTTPAVNANVSALNGFRGIFASGHTDEAGAVNLSLPPGQYQLTIKPNRDTTPPGFLKTDVPFVVKETPQEQPSVVQVPAACTLKIEVTDADTGKAIPNVAIAVTEEDEAEEGWNKTEWRMIVGHTDAAGKFNRLVAAGKRSYHPVAPRDYSVVDESAESVDLAAGKTVSLRFKLRKQAAKEDKPKDETDTRDAPRGTTAFTTDAPDDKPGPKPAGDPAAQRALEQLKALGAQPATLKQIGIQSGWKGSDADLKLINELPELNWLYIEFERVGAGALAELKIEHPMEFLAFRELSDAVLEKTPRLPRCGHLNLMQYALSKDGFRLLADRAQGIEFLEFNGPASPAEQYPASVGLTDEGLKQISQIRSLKGLQLFDLEKITDDGLSHLAGLEKLEDLNMYSCAGVRGPGYASLAPIQSLRRLWISQSINPEGLAAIAKLTQLEFLKLQPIRRLSAEIKPDDVDALKNLANLRTFEIYGLEAKTPLSGAILSAAGQMKSLRSFRLLQGATVDAQGIDAFSKAAELQELYLDRFEYSERSLAAIARLKKLQKLGLGGVGPVSDAVLQQLANFEQLTQLTIVESGLDDNGLARLANLSALEILNLPDSKITGAGLASLGNLKKLKTLTLSNSPFDDEGSKNLRELPSVEFLYLNKTKITDGSIENIAALTKIRMLTLSDTAVTVDGLAKLKALKRLSYLNVEGLKATEPEMEGLRKSLPLVQIMTEAPPGGITGSFIINRDDE